MQKSRDENNLARIRVSSTSPHDEIYANVLRLPFPLGHREAVFRQISVLDSSGDYFVATESVDEKVDWGFTRRMKTTRIKTRGFVRVSALNDGPFPQCVMTSNIYIDVSGYVPAWVVNAKIPLALGSAVSVRRELQSDREVDEHTQSRIADFMAAERQVRASGSGAASEARQRRAKHASGERSTPVVSFLVVPPIHCSPFLMLSLSTSAWRTKRHLRAGTSAAQKRAQERAQKRSQ
jgi:hypothetical protein